MGKGMRLLGEDNDSYMFIADHNVGRCTKCGRILDKGYVNPKFELMKDNYDVSYTYDGYCVVSNKLKEFCARFHCEEVDFVPLPSVPGFFVFLVRRVVEFDSERRKTRFENYCDACRRFETVVGANPVFLKSQEPLQNGFFRTDLEFGSGDEQHPLLLVGHETYERLRREKLKGVTFEGIKG